uniref:Protein disulfide isomerase like, testis expressed n=1 Tax=Anas platyrhynchos platyrhynchos TaxID=8840 RepID=A0A493TDB9_ANAPP
CSKYLIFQIPPSCGKTNLSEEFAEAARQLKKEAPRIQFGKIDVTDQHDLRKEFNIQEFPTVKFFVDGSREDPIDFCSSSSSLQFPQLTAKDVPEMPFGMTSREDVCANYGIQKNTLVVFKKVGVQNKLDLTRLIKTFTLDLVTEYNLETSVKIFDVPVENHILLFIPTNSKTFNATYENYKSAAMEFRGKITFVLVNTNETRNGRVFEYFRIRDIDVPAVRILNLTSNAKYKMPADEVTLENLRHFCQSYLDGKAKIHLSSEEITEDWDKMPVKVLVGKNFNRIVFNKTMTVFVMFYAPWSHDCRKLLLIWDELGEKYQNRKDIIIAKIDVTANDILSVVLDRYPFFRLFPAGADYQVRSFRGRTGWHSCTLRGGWLEIAIPDDRADENQDSSGSINCL